MPIPVLPFPVMPNIASALARIALGALFLVHGIPKIRNPRQAIEFVRSTGFPAGAVFATLFTLLEFFGGIALLLGFLTQVVGALIALEMVATSIFAKTKLGRKFVGGYELDVSYLVLGLVVALHGGGAWSIDGLLGLT